MKKTDFAMIILIASISVGVAFGVVSAIPGLKLSNEAVKVKTIDPYTSDLSEPDPTLFNKDAINPTVDVTIGNGSPDVSDDIVGGAADQEGAANSNTSQPDDTSQSSEQ